MSYRAFLSRWRRESFRRGRWGRQVVLRVYGEAGTYQWRNLVSGWHIVRLLPGKPPTYHQATYAELEAIRRAWAVGAVEVEERPCGVDLSGGLSSEVLLRATGRAGQWIAPEGGHEMLRLHREITRQYRERRAS